MKDRSSGKMGEKKEGSRMTSIISNNESVKRKGWLVWKTKTFSFLFVDSAFCKVLCIQWVLINT